MRTRLAILAAAALLSLASAGSSNSKKQHADGDSWIDGDHVFVRLVLDDDNDAIAVFRSGGENKGCQVQESTEGDQRIIVVNCSEGMFGATQSGRTVTYGCPHAERNAEQCKEYALALINGAGSGGSGTSSSSSSTSSSSIEMSHTDDGTPYFEMDFSSSDTSGTDLFNVADTWFKAAGCTDVAQKRDDGYVQGVCAGIIIVGVPIDDKLHVGCAQSSDSQCQGIHELLMTTLHNM